MFLLFLVSIWFTLPVVHAQPLESHSFPYKSESFLEVERSLNNLAINGPSEVCLFSGPSIVTFNSGGNPNDFYLWRVTRLNGDLLVERSGGYPSFNFTFSELGSFQIHLEVRRGQNVLFTGEKTVVAITGDAPLLVPNYLLCDQGSTQLQVFDPQQTNVSLYVFEWRNSQQQVVGTTNSIEVNASDTYTVKVHRRGANGEVLCPLNLSTVVNIPQDVNVKMSLTEVCHGGVVIRAESGGIFGSWYYQREGIQEKVFIAEGANIQFTSAAHLAGPGNYNILFEADNRNQNFCPAAVAVPFRVNIPGDALFLVERQPNSCSDNQGVMVIEALTDLDRIRVTRDNQVVFVVNAMQEGERIRLENLPAGIYTLRVGLGPCGKARTAILGMQDPNAQDLYQINTIQDEGCLSSPNPLGGFTVDFKAPFTGSYKVYNANGNLQLQAPIQQLEQVNVSLPAGIYYFEVVDEVNCSTPYPQMIRIDRKETVQFTHPTRIIVCEFLEWMPTTAQPLEFVLSFPDQKEVRQIAGNAFKLDQSGIYTITGIDPTGVLCPLVRFFEVEVVPTIQFEPELLQWDCFGNRKYRAKISGSDPSMLDIKWYNDKGEVVGTSIEWIPQTFGWFTLEVKPRNAEICPVSQIPFYVEDNSRAQNAYISGDPLCLGSTVLTLEANLSPADQILWMFHDPELGVQIMEDKRGSESVEVEIAGRYEVVILDENGCELGRSSFVLEEGARIEDLEAPEELTICGFTYWTPDSRENLRYLLIYPDGEEIEHGRGERFLLDQSGEYVLRAWGVQKSFCPFEISFTLEVIELFDYEVDILEENCEGRNTYFAVVEGAIGVNLAYFWFDQNGQLVYEGNFFQPATDGQYSLEVRPENTAACPIDRKEFVVVNDCKPEVVFPNAMVPLDPERMFKVFGNAFVSKMEVWIYNKWGNLVYQSVCQQDNGFVGCEWDGTVLGKSVIGGVYHVKVNYYSSFNGAFHQKHQQLVVIE